MMTNDESKENLKYKALVKLVIVGLVPDGKPLEEQLLFNFNEPSKVQQLVCFAAEKAKSLQSTETSVFEFIKVELFDKDFDTNTLVEHTDDVEPKGTYTVHLRGTSDPSQILETNNGNFEFLDADMPSSGRTSANSFSASSAKNDHQHPSTKLNETMYWDNLDVGGNFSKLNSPENFAKSTSSQMLTDVTNTNLSEQFPPRVFEATGCQQEASMEGFHEHMPEQLKCGQRSQVKNGTNQHEQFDKSIIGGGSQKQLNGNTTAYQTTYQTAYQQQHHQSQINVNKSTYEAAQIVRQSLGTVAHLGNFYDAKTDNFTTSLPLEFTTSNNSTAANTSILLGSEKAAAWRPNGRLWKCVNTPNYDFASGGLGMEERFEVLNIGVDQKVSLLSGLSRSENNVFGDFLTVGDVDEDEAFVISRTFTTKKVLIHTGNSAVVEQFFEQQIDEATHVVTGIGYGAVVACVFKCQSLPADVDLAGVKKIIEKWLKSGYIYEPDKCVLEGAGITAKFHADPAFELPQHEISLKEAVDVFTTFSNMRLKTLNGGMGVPVFYEMSPLQAFVKPEFLEPANVAPSQLDISTVNRLLDVFQLLDDFQLQFKWLRTLIDSFGYCFTEQQFIEGTQISEEFDEQKRQCLQSCQQLIASMRSSTHFSTSSASSNYKRQAEIKRVCEECTMGLSRFFTYFNSLRPVKAKCHLAEYLQSKNVLYVGRSNFTKLPTEIGQLGPNKSCFVYFHNSDVEDQQESFKSVSSAASAMAISFSANNQLFNRLIASGEHCVYVDDAVLRGSGRPEGVPADGALIVKYRNGQPVVTDYLAEEKRKRCTCIARIVKGVSVDAAQPRPTNLLPLEVPCPKWMDEANVKGCPDDDCRWECDDCGELVEFDKDNQHFYDCDSDIRVTTDPIVDYLYCNCGRTLASNFTFRCRMRGLHGDQFVGFSQKSLKRALNQLRYFGEKSILVIGESGVGKSTWINSIANYQLYSSLEDATQADNSPAVLIPAQFIVNKRNVDGAFIDYNDDANVQVIKVGPEDANEVRSKPGQSGTKMARSYLFDYKTGKLRLVDTAGVLDTDGVDQDKKNIDNTLRSIANLKDLHGICILMNANNTRKNASFTYCIGELLTHLSKDAAKNIVFCFTQSRSQNYSAGLTMNVLREYLRELNQKYGVNIPLNSNTIYCMDNEAFNCLCLYKNGVNWHSETHFNTFSDSWNISSTETNRLLKYIMGLKPHRTKDTITLNEARRFIVTIAKPLADISKLIQANITAITNHQEDLASLDVDSKDFEARLCTPVVNITILPLNHPRTVCVSPTCTEVKKDSAGQPHTIYNTHCHPHCGLDGVMPNTHPNEDLKGCWAMTERRNGNQSCRNCGCYWYEHMHIRYDQIEETGTIVNNDENAKNLRNTYNDRKAALQKKLDENNARIGDYKAEQSKIIDIAVKYGWFLKQNAILPYNDAIKPYLQQAIVDAKKEVADVATNDYTKVKRMEELLQEYEEQKAIIQNSSSTEIEAVDIKLYYSELISLPLTGKTIKELFDHEEKANDVQSNYTERQYTGQKAKKATKDYRAAASGSFSYHDRLYSDVAAGSSSSLYHNAPAASSMSSSMTDPFYANNQSLTSSVISWGMSKIGLGGSTTAGSKSTNKSKYSTSKRPAWK